jgi:hypothetical protein
MTDWREAPGFIWAYVADIWAYVVDVFSTPESATAVFTGVLAVSTIALWWSTRKLWRVTRIAAEHIPHVERAYVSGGATGVENSPEHFAVTIDNYGKTPAFIGTIWAKIVPQDELPDTPVYDPPEFGWFGGQMLKPQTSGHPTVVRLWDVVEGRVIYGRIWYRDIFKQCHSAGFILRIRGPGQTIAVANRDAYWEDRDERDLGPAARDPAAVSEPANATRRPTANAS